MILRAFLFILGLFVGACAQSAQYPPFPSHEEAALDLQDKTVALVGLDMFGRAKPFCSGVWVSDASVLTAYHCVAEAEVNAFAFATHDDVYAPGELHARTPGIYVRPAVLVAVDQDHDLALLRARGSLPSHRVARVALDTVQAGSIVQSMSHPQGMWWSYSRGDVALIRQAPINDHDILWTQTTTPISKGSSGCGLFDTNGSLVGIAHGTVSTGQGLNFFVHSQYLDAFLRKQPNL